MGGTSGGDGWVWMIPLIALTGLSYVKATAMCPAAVKKVGSPLKCEPKPCDTLLHPMCFSAVFRTCEEGPTKTKWNNMASVCLGVTLGKLMPKSGFSVCDGDIRQSGHYWVADCPGLVISTTTISTQASTTTTTAIPPTEETTTTTAQPNTTSVDQRESSTATTSPTLTPTTTTTTTSTATTTTTPTTTPASTTTSSTATETSPTPTRSPLTSSTPTVETTLSSTSTQKTTSPVLNTLFSSPISADSTQPPSVGTRSTPIPTYKTTASTKNTHFSPSNLTESTHTRSTAVIESSSTISSPRSTTNSDKPTEVFSTTPNQTNTSITQSATSHPTISSSHNSLTSVPTSLLPGQKSSSGELHSTKNEDNDHWKHVQTTVIAVGIVAVVMLILIAAILIFGIRHLNRTLQKATRTPMTESDQQRQTGHRRMAVFTDSGHYSSAHPDELACIDTTMFGVRTSNRNTNCRNDATAGGHCRPNYSENSQPEPETGLREHGHTRATENHYAPLPDVQERYIGRDDVSLHSLSRSVNSRTNLIPENVTDPTYAVVNRL